MREEDYSVSCFLYYQTSTSAVLLMELVMSMPTAIILLVLIFVRVKLDTVEMEKHAKVDKRTVSLNMKSATMASTIMNKLIALYSR